MIRAGQYREFVVQILTSPYFFALSLTIFVPILWLVLYNVYPFWQARPKPNAVVVKPTVTLSQKAEDQHPYEPYPPSPTDDEARAKLRQRLEPLKYLCKGLLNKTEKSKIELGWERVVVIESEKFSREFGAFDASTIYARVDDKANRPLCFVFLVSERDDGVILKSLGHAVEESQGPRGVYFKVRYQVPAVEKDDRLIIVIGLSDQSYNASVNYQANTLDNSKKALTIAVER